MDKFDGYKQQLEKDLADDSKPWVKYLKLAEEKTGVSRLYLFLGELRVVAILSESVREEKYCNSLDPLTAEQMFNEKWKDSSRLSTTSSCSVV